LQALIEISSRPLSWDDLLKKLPNNSFQLTGFDIVNDRNELSIPFHQGVNFYPNAAVIDWRSGCDLKFLGLTLIATPDAERALATMRRIVDVGNPLDRPFERNKFSLRKIPNEGAQ
jgi:hypothetical protein